MKRDKNTDKQIVESFTKHIHERYKDGNTLIKRIDCEFSEYTKEYFGILEGIKSENKDFVEVYRYGGNGTSIPENIYKR